MTPETWPVPDCRMQTLSAAALSAAMITPSPEPCVRPPLAEVPACCRRGSTRADARGAGAAGDASAFDDRDVLRGRGDEVDRADIGFLRCRAGDDLGAGSLVDLRAGVADGDPGEVPRAVAADIARGRRDGGAGGRAADA